MDIIMIRHGETEDNMDRVYSRDTTKLTSKGIEQIKRTKENIKDLKFSKVYYSPLTRTKETIKYLELDGIAENRIKEVDFGIFSGSDYETILKNYPKETKIWTENPITYGIPQGESVEIAYNRLKDFLEEVIEKDENILLITHEGIIRLVCCWILDNIECFFKFKADNGSINIVSVVDDYKYISKLNYNPRLK